MRCRKRTSRLARHRRTAGASLSPCVRLPRLSHAIIIATPRSLRHNQLAKTEVARATRPPCAPRCCPPASRPSSWPPPPRASPGSSPSGAFCIRRSGRAILRRKSAGVADSRAFLRLLSHQRCAGGGPQAVVPVVPARRRLGLDGRGGGAVLCGAPAARPGAPLRCAAPLRLLRRAGQAMGHAPRRAARLARQGTRVASSGLKGLTAADSRLLRPRRSASRRSLRATPAQRSGWRRSCAPRTLVSTRSANLSPFPFLPPSPR